MTVKEWQKEFTSRVLRAMDRKDMSQKDLAEAANVSEPSISKYLNRQRIPNIKTIVNLAQALGCTVSYLVEFGEMVVGDEE